MTVQSNYNKKNRWFSLTIWCF